jgi:hypothetical protein
VSAIAGLEDPLSVGPERVASDERCGCHDVYAGLEDGDEFVDVGPLWVIDDAVGTEGEERGAVVSSVSKGRDTVALWS